MNCDKELNLTHSKSKAQWWRMGLIGGFIVIFGILNFGCDNCDNGNEISVSDEYYVKYEVNSSTIYIGGKLNVTLNVNSASETYNQLRLYTNIYVSKNGSPFALKKSDGSDTPRNSVQINYTIDY